MVADPIFHRIFHFFGDQRYWSVNSLHGNERVRYFGPARLKLWKPARLAENCNGSNLKLLTVVLFCVQAKPWTCFMLGVMNLNLWCVTPWQGNHSRPRHIAFRLTYRYVFYLCFTRTMFSFGSCAELKSRKNSESLLVRQYKAQFLSVRSVLQISPVSLLVQGFISPAIKLQKVPKSLATNGSFMYLGKWRQRPLTLSAWGHCLQSHGWMDGCTVLLYRVDPPRVAYRLSNCSSPPFAERAVCFFW